MSLSPVSQVNVVPPYRFALDPEKVIKIKIITILIIMIMRTCYYYYSNKSKCKLQSRMNVLVTGGVGEKRVNRMVEIIKWWLRVCLSCWFWNNETSQWIEYYLLTYILTITITTVVVVAGVIIIMVSEAYHIWIIISIYTVHFMWSSNFAQM